MIMVVAIIEKPGVLVKVGDRSAVDYDGCAVVGSSLITIFHLESFRRGAGAADAGGDHK